MSPGGIDLKVVSDRLEIVESCIRDLERLPVTASEEFAADFRNAATAESLLRRAIEALFDATRHLLARGFGLGALEYRQAARLAGEKGLVDDASLAARFVEIGGFRNRLSHFYDEVTPEELRGTIQDDLGDLRGLAEQLRRAAQRLAGGS